MSAAGERWRSAREAAGLTVEEAAKRIEISKGHIYNLEKGDDGITLRVMAKAADIYGVTLGEIFRNGREPERVPSEYRPLVDALTPLDHEARVSIVRNIASNLRFMQTLYVDGSKIRPSVTTAMQAGTSSGERKEVLTDEPIEPRTSR